MSWDNPRTKCVWDIIILVIGLFLKGFNDLSLIICVLKQWNTSHWLKVPIDQLTHIKTNGHDTDRIHIIYICTYIPKHIVASFYLWSNRSPTRWSRQHHAPYTHARRLHQLLFTRRQRGCLSRTCFSHRTECKAQHETSIIQSPDLKGLWSVRARSSWDPRGIEYGLTRSRLAS